MFSIILFHYPVMLTHNYGRTEILTTVVNVNKSNPTYLLYYATHIYGVYICISAMVFPEQTIPIF